MIFSKDFSWDPEKFSDAVLFYDQNIPKFSTEFRKWKKRFAHAVPLRAGEKLKSFESLQKILKKVHRLCGHRPPSKIHFVACGGGSVTDFVGFLASIYKRGVRITFVPSTWLAAIDSAHGGKTGINYSKEKNQIGTFYPATEIFLIEKLLFSQPQQREWEALPELIKIFLISSPGNIRKLAKDLRPLRFAPGELLTPTKRKINLRNTLLKNLLFKYLPDAIKAKLKIVKKDPFETRGLRRVLNLGHTLGHALEANLGVPHGIGVAEGLVFSLNWSVSLGLMRPGVFQKLESHLFDLLPKIPIKNKYLTMAKLEKSFSVDKKIAESKRLHFVFLKDVGQPRVKEVRIHDLLIECRRQGWIK